MSLIVPYFAQAQTASITIDGVTYRVPLIDSGGRLYTNAYATGASEVKAARGVSATPSTTRATVVTPTAGKKVRLISFIAGTFTATGFGVELYFGSGANIGITAGKEVADFNLEDANLHYFSVVWPDGAGPVGAADDVLSMRTDTDVLGGLHVTVHYREE